MRQPWQNKRDRPNQKQHFASAVFQADNETSPPPPPPPPQTTIKTTNQNITHKHWPPTYLPAPPPRPWLETNFQATGSPKQQLSNSNPEFTVLSYNVLCDRMVKQDIFPSSPDIALNWNYRRDLILNQLIDFNADIVALQELEIEQFESYFQPKLYQAANYHGIFEPKSRAKTMEGPKRRRVDGCAIFFKADKFKLIQRHLLEYNQIAMANARGSEAMLNRVMTKDNIGLAAILEFIEPTTNLNGYCGGDDDDYDDSSRQRILVCNTHIHWDPECCDVKLIQTIMLMNELECIAKNYKQQEETENFEASAKITQPQQQSTLHKFNSTTALGPNQQIESLQTRDFNSNFYGASTANAKIDDEIPALTPPPHSTTDVNDLLPLVLLGDFNSLPNSGVTSYLTSGEINSLHEDFLNFKYTSCSNALSCFLSRSLSRRHGNATQPANHPVSLTSGSFDYTSLPQDQTSNYQMHPENLLRRQSSPAWCFYSTSPTSTSPTSSGVSSLSSSPQKTSSMNCDDNSKRNFLTTVTSGDEIFNYVHPFKLQSAYESDTMDYTNYTTKFKAIIDYIFFSQNSIRLMGLLGPLDKNWLNCNHIIGLPQPYVPSDHLPLLVKLKLVNNFNCSSTTTPPPTPPFNQTNQQKHYDNLQQHNNHHRHHHHQQQQQYHRQYNQQQNNHQLNQRNPYHNHSKTLNHNQSQSSYGNQKVMQENFSASYNKKKIKQSRQFNARHDEDFPNELKQTKDYSHICQNFGKRSEGVNIRKRMNLLNHNLSKAL